MQVKRPHTSSTIEEALTAARKELLSVSTDAFSASALEKLGDCISDQIEYFVHESVRLAAREKSTVVSAKHVMQACDHVISGNRDRLYRHLGSVGGALLGCGIASFMMLDVSNFSTVRVAAAAICTAIGSFLLALHIARD